MRHHDGHVRPGRCRCAAPTAVAGIVGGAVVAIAAATRDPAIMYCPQSRHQPRRPSCVQLCVAGGAAAACRGLACGGGVVQWQAERGGRCVAVLYLICCCAARPCVPGSLWASLVVLALP